MPEVNTFVKIRNLNASPGLFDATDGLKAVRASARLGPLASPSPHVLP